MNLSAEIDKIEAGHYISLATRKRSGDFVPTPVWFAPTGNAQYAVFSAGNAGKVKRLRNFSEAKVARCTVIGNLTGPWLPARAELLSSDVEITQAHRALRKKYGLLMLIGDFLSDITGKRSKRAYIRVTLDVN